MCIKLFYKILNCLENSSKEIEKLIDKIFLIKWNIIEE